MIKRQRKPTALNLTIHSTVDYFGYLKGIITTLWKKERTQIKIKTKINQKAVETRETKTKTARDFSLDPYR